jgi:hypothetical protein
LYESTGWGIVGQIITEDYEYGINGSNFGNGNIIFVPIVPFVSFCSGGSGGILFVVAAIAASAAAAPR